MNKITTSPWGEVQDSIHIADGIDCVKTAGHGGFKLSPERHATIKQKFPLFETFAGGAWYEEDCDVTVVVVTFPEYFDASAVAEAKRIINRDKGYFKHSVE